MARGRFITFEGIDGSGKTTILQRIDEVLRSSGLRYQVTREPGGTPIGYEIRTILLNAAHHQLVPSTELLLYAADRAQHVSQLIQPALQAGRHVLCDRYADATIAYQGYGRGHDLEWVQRLMEFATGGLKPDLTVVLDLEVEIAQRRVRTRSGNLMPMFADRLDAETLEFHQRVRNGYLRLAEQEAERVHIIPAAAEIERVAEMVYELVVNALQPR
ncbi:MAG: dTMP kinase [Acidobacteria bacterium]|nr:dTMP kinase [Acidobacteriota bacterium]